MKDDRQLSPEEARLVQKLKVLMRARQTSAVLRQNYPLTGYHSGKQRRFPRAKPFQGLYRFEETPEASCGAYLSRRRRMNFQKLRKAQRLLEAA